jgi:hypothetical protein
MVNFILDDFAAGAAVSAEATSKLPATKSMAARQTLMRSIGIPLILFLDGIKRQEAAGRDGYVPRR